MYMEEYQPFQTNFSPRQETQVINLQRFKHLNVERIIAENDIDLLEELIPEIIYKQIPPFERDDDSIRNLIRISQV